MAVLDHYVQGSFTADGNAHIINIPSDVDFMEVENQTRIITPQAGTGVKFRWMRGFASGAAIQEATDGAGVLTISGLSSGGFSLVNTADPQTPGAQLSGTAISNAAIPIASSAATTGVSNGSIVELYNVTGGKQFEGMQFTVDSVVANTSFRLVYAPQIVAATTFNYRVIPNQAQYYPRRLFITKITQAASAVVTFSVTHNLTVGQRLVFGNIPSMYGMTQMSGLRGLITAIDTTNNTVTVDIDSSAFTAFAFPVTATAATAHTQPSAVPFGDGPYPAANPLGNQSVLDGATRNVAIHGMLLGGGANGPAGQNGDVIYWRAWKAEQLQSSYFS